MTAAAAYLASQDLLLYAGIVLLLASVMDMLDGALARLTNRAGPFGAVLDSVADRLGEALLLVGLVVLYLDEANNTGGLRRAGVLVHRQLLARPRRRGWHSHEGKRPGNQGGARADNGAGTADGLGYVGFSRVTGRVCGHGFAASAPYLASD